MKTVDELTADEQALRDQLAQIERDKQQAAQKLKDDQLDAISFYEDQAISYRNQAAKALTDDDKKKLYGYAEDAEQQAYELRKELGLLPEGEPSNEAERRKQAKLKTLRKINGLFFKALFALLAYLIADFSSGKIEMGFISYALKSTGQILYSISAALGALWLAALSLFGFVSYYCIDELKTDFLSLSPTVRVSLLVALLAAILHFFTAIVPHAI